VTGYSDQHRPLAAYGVLTTAFGALFGGGIAALHGRMPERPRATDVALAGVATYKISRLLAKDRVTSVLRAPFTRYEGEAGPSEVSEEPRGRGMQLALGELLVCPYCLGVWISAAFTAGLLVVPRFTRWFAAVLTALFGADLLQIAYKKAEDTL
jgi:hypothetical protein